MARLPRRVLPGLAHLLTLRAAGERPVFADDTDRAMFIEALRQALPGSGVQLHGWALPEREALLLVRPAQAEAASRWIQSVGRRFVAAFNRRHGRRGSPWDGRFRCAPVEPGETLLALLAWLDTAAGPGATSAQARLADAGHPLLTPPTEFWTLGNTPFERQAAWQARLDVAAAGAAGDPPWRRAALGGWAIGSADFRANVETQSGVPATPRRPGRPRRISGI